MKNIPILFVYLISIFIIFIFKLSEFECSLLMCFNFIVVLYEIWHTNKLSSLLFFSISFTFLFIGGRFWAVLLGYNESLWYGNFFKPDYINLERQSELMFLVLSFLYFMLLGYRVSINKYKNEKYVDGENLKMSRILYYSYFPLASLLLMNSVSLLQKAKLGGYHILYSSQSEDYSGNNYVQTLFYVFLGMSMVYGSNKVRIMYIILLIVQSLITILVGARGALGACLFFLLMLLFERYKINIIKLTIGGIASLFCLLFVFKFSVRYENSGISDTDIISSISGFLYSQGISLSVFEQSLDMKYPIIPYFNSIIPGPAKIYQLFSGENLKPWEVSFANALSYNLNPRLYLGGQGLGWTCLSDIYLYSMKNKILFCIISVCFGYFVGYIEKKAYSNLTIRVIYYTIFILLMLLPRSGINVIFPLIIYTLIIHRFIFLIYKK